MISRAHRFHGYNALRHVYGRGETVRGQVLAVKFLANPKRSSYRAAVVVSKKVHKSAVVRGRIRRRLYEILRLHAYRMSQPWDIVLLVFSENVATMEPAKLSEMVVEQLERAHIINPATSGQKPITHGIVDTKELNK